MKRIATFVIACYAVSAWAGGMESLESFVRTVKTARTDFTQVVTMPAREGQAVRTRTSSGTFEFSRPGQFRFVYKKPFEQTIVADGQTLWLYDVDLNQVTARKQDQVLSTTPAALIASAADIKALQVDFVLTPEADRDALEWVLATPKARDSALQAIRVGFRAGELAALEIVDTFGQRSALRFTAFKANVALDAGAFQFKPPQGADVIRQ
jgi:outer membrane lipoprotein carrier protein